MSPAAAHFPAPSGEALQHSNALATDIRAAIDRAGGWIDFAQFMQLALYAPGRGYYSAGSRKLGAAGDFMTAPEIGGLLGRALAATLHRELAPFDTPTVLELGAGSGKLAAQVLDALAELGDSRMQYRILEPSAELQDRQRRTLERFGARVAWLDGLPAPPMTGALLANEVLDALPVARFVKRAGRVRPLGVCVRGGRFHWAEGAEQPALSIAVAAIERALEEPLPDGYRSEVCLPLPAWFEGVAATLARGSLLFVDYGLVRREYYHRERRDGTLICHYRHRAHGDPFLYPGLQDVSAWVDFSACADAAVAAGLAVAGFTTQAQFLLAALAAEPPRAGVDSASIRELAAVKTMLLPGEMGERFKVLLLRKNVGGEPLPGRDFRDRL